MTKGRALSRRRVLGVLGAATAALAPGGGRAFAGEARRCYVDAVNGDDSRDGASPGSAIKSLAGAARLRPHPTWIGLARGAHFRGTLRLVPGQIVEAYGNGAAPIVDAASDLDGDAWTDLGNGTWAYGAKIRRAHRLILDGRAIGEKRELTADDPAGSWAWIQGRLRLRSARPPREAFRAIQAIDRSCVQAIDAGGCSVRGVAAVNGVHGFLGQRSTGVVLADCSARHCARNGFYLADDVAAWRAEDCVAERNGGAGFAFNYGAARSTVVNSRAAWNGVDGCQFSEGCGSDNSLVGCVFVENDIAGVNCKEKKQKVMRCRIEGNGEAGVIAQINTDLLEISDSVLAGNNRADNGTMNLALEDHAVVLSVRNIFIGAHGRDKPAVNARLTGRSSLRSVTDCFIDRERGANVVASIRVATAEPSALTIVHGSFYNAVSPKCRVIDCRDAPQLTLSIFNTAVESTGTCLAYDAAAKVSSGHNCYHNAAGGLLVEVGGPTPRRVTAENLRGFAADTGVEENSIAADPRFARPGELDLSLAPDSPARRAGKPLATRTDALNAPYGSPPHIGAIAADGDLRVRLRP